MKVYKGLQIEFPVSHICWAYFFFMNSASRHEAKFEATKFGLIGFLLYSASIEKRNCEAKSELVCCWGPARNAKQESLIQREAGTASANARETQTACSRSSMHEKNSLRPYVCQKIASCRPNPNAASVWGISQKCNVCIYLRQAQIITGLSRKGDKK
jgi:hypothetical protein